MSWMQSDMVLFLSECLGRFLKQKIPLVRIELIDFTSLE